MIILINDSFIAPRGESFWAGATDKDEEGVWRWVNVTDPFNCESEDYFCDWHEGEPGGGETESCLQVFNDAWWDQNHWNDASCTDTLTHYICEKPLSQDGDTKKKVWIGLDDLDSTQTLTWTDGSPVTFTKW